MAAVALATSSARCDMVFLIMSVQTPVMVIILLSLFRAADGGQSARCQNDQGQPLVWGLK